MSDTLEPKPISRVRKIRIAARINLTAAAAMAGRSPHTYRSFELGGRGAVSQAAADDCEKAVRKMLAIIEGRAA